MLIGLFVALLLLILFGIPVLLAIGTVALSGILIVPELVPAMFPQKMFTMLDSFSLLAMPYFILAGELMAKGGISKKLVEFAETVVGHLRGGLGMAAVVASMIFAGVSGSATADTSAIGSILIPSMKERGYKPGFAASLLATAGTIGPIIPPSMTMIVYGSMAGVSIGGLFLGGIIPGILIGVGLMLTIYLHSFFPQFPELRQTSGKFNLKKVLKASSRVWLALIAPLIILGGILGGIFTATEAGVVACFYSFIVTFFIYRSVSWKALPKILVDAAVTTTMVVGIISVAGAFGWLLAYLDFNEVVLDLLKSISNTPMVVLLVLLATMLVLTMFVESLAILVILIPVAVFVSKNFGFDQYHFGLLMVMATQIGATTPPVAVLLFVATSIADTTYDQTIKYCLPFIATLIIVMLLVAFIPGLAAWIPNHFLGP
ncbi:TRAP-type C4-dicarboxylate transport system, large permease component [Candidatus Vecturithrix granuli]|uniref:TRAP-type C4-dicarboxylate transport system, large permease component n=1 Tax=Vecturithrix granuli TaxID=1499967 RepID=A0A081CAW2_VECG1|nr:TRAP-type C4-dicarboxylate transport system, large permease component [Candidatus Vecturithrix granuli]